MRISIFRVAKTLVGDVVVILFRKRSQNRPVLGNINVMFNRRMKLSENEHAVAKKRSTKGYLG